ncbi:hypothetical protein HY468_00020, partial [Candidatus Roizmanbacteria bacterium]|nr:hypothetical protein [Candidatus Roizmanbacteria bacterium]
MATGSAYGGYLYGMQKGKNVDVSTINESVVPVVLNPTPSKAMSPKP